MEFEVIDVFMETAGKSCNVGLLCETTTALAGLVRLGTRYDDLERFRIDEDPGIVFRKECDDILLELLRKTVRKVKSFLDQTSLVLHEQELSARDKPAREHYLYLVQVQDFVMSMNIAG